MDWSNVIAVGVEEWMDRYFSKFCEKWYPMFFSGVTQYYNVNYP